MSSEGSLGPGGDDGASMDKISNQPVDEISVDLVGETEAKTSSPPGSDRQLTGSSSFGTLLSLQHKPPTFKFPNTLEKGTTRETKPFSFLNSGKKESFPMHQKPKFSFSNPTSSPPSSNVSSFSSPSTSSFTSSSSSISFSSPGKKSFNFSWGKKTNATSSSILPSDDETKDRNDGACPSSPIHPPNFSNEHKFASAPLSPLILSRFDEVYAWERSILSTLPSDLGQACFDIALGIEQLDVERARKWLEIGCEAGTAGSVKAKPFLEVLSSGVKVSLLQFSTLKNHKKNIATACLEVGASSTDDWDYAKEWFRLSAEYGSSEAPLFMKALTSLRALGNVKPIKSLTKWERDILISSSSSSLGIKCCCIAFLQSSESTCKAWLQLAASAGHEGARVLVKWINTGDFNTYKARILGEKVRKTGMSKSFYDIGEVCLYCALEDRTPPLSRMVWLEVALIEGNVIAKEVKRQIELVEGTMLPEHLLIMKNLISQKNCLAGFGNRYSLNIEEGYYKVGASSFEYRKWLETTSKLKTVWGEKAREALSTIKRFEDEVGDLNKVEYDTILQDSSGSGCFELFSTAPFDSPVERRLKWLSLAAQLSDNEFYKELLFLVTTVANESESKCRGLLKSIVYVCRREDISSGWLIAGECASSPEISKRYYEFGSQSNTRGGGRCKVALYATNFINGTEFYRDEATYFASQADVWEGTNGSETIFRPDRNRCRRYLVRSLLSGSLNKNHNSPLYRSFFLSGMREVNLFPIVANYVVGGKDWCPEPKRLNYTPSPTSPYDAYIQTIGGVCDIIFADSPKLSSLFVSKFPHPFSKYLSSDLCPPISKLSLSFKCDLSAFRGSNICSSLTILEILKCKSTRFTLSPLSACSFPCLEVLNVRDCTHLTSLDGLTNNNTNSLKKLTVYRCNKLNDISALSECELPSLSVLNLSYVSDLRDISPLLSLSHCLDNPEFRLVLRHGFSHEYNPSVLEVLRERVNGLELGH